MLKFKRSKTDKLVSGIFGGLAERFNVDSTLLRIVWLIALGLTGFIPGIIVYLIVAATFPINNSRKRSLLQRLTKIA